MPLHSQDEEALVPVQVVHSWTEVVVLGKCSVPVLSVQVVDSEAVVGGSSETLVMIPVQVVQACGDVVVS